MVSLALKIGIRFAVPASLFLLAILGKALAGGYAIPYQGAKALGLGNAVTAGIRDPSAVYSNPGALSEIQGNKITGGSSYINVASNVINRGRKSINRHDDNSIMTLFGNYHIPATDFTLGIGLYTPFGLATSYDDSSFTRFAAIRSELKTLYLTSAIAWRANPFLSVGAGLSFVHSSALFSRALFLGPAVEGRIRLTDTDDAYAYNLGVLLKLNEKIKFGFTYRGRVDLDFDTARVKVSDATGAISTARSKGTHIPLPPVISMGLNWQITPAWALLLAYDYTRWSDFRHLKARFSPALLGGALRGLFIQEKWKSTSTFRLGTSYRLYETWSLRAGLVLDETPIPASTLGPSIPGADSLTLNGGFGYKWGDWSVDLGYAAIFYKTRRVNNDVLEANSSSTLTPGRDKYAIFDNFVSFDIRYRF